MSLHKKARLPGSLLHEKFVKACRGGRLDDVEQLVLGSSTAIDVNQPSNDRKTALFHAITSRCLPLVRFLLKCGANVRKRSFVFFRLDCSAFNFESCDEPPLVTAARSGSTDILRCLLQNGAEANDQSEIPSHRHKGYIEGFDGGGGGGGGSLARGGGALHFACEAGNLDMVQLLLDHGARVNAADHKLERPLHLAVRCRTSLCAAQRQIVELLCENGADVNAVNKKECSALYLSALYGCTANVDVLLRHGASVNSGCSTAGGHGSALHVAAYKDRLELASLLVAHGACINHVNALGVTALQLNVAEHSRSEIAPLLVYHGARMDGRDRHGRTLLAMCIHNLRLDCESLTVLMVQAGYDLRHDLWLDPLHSHQPDHDAFDSRPTADNSAPPTFRPSSRSGIRIRSDPGSGTRSAAAAASVVPPVTIPEGRVRRLCDWLRVRQETPRSLSETCRMVLRRHLSDCSGGRTIVPSIYRLPLPTAIKNFVLLKDPTGSNIESPILSFLTSIECSSS